MLDISFLILFVWFITEIDRRISVKYERVGIFATARRTLNYATYRIIYEIVLQAYTEAQLDVKRAEHILTHGLLLCKVRKKRTLIC